MTRLKHLGLPRKTVEILHRAGIRSIEQLGPMYPKDIGNLRGMSPARGKAVVQAALKHGVTGIPSIPPLPRDWKDPLVS